ncbi:MAG: hypothetical protein LBS77_02065 [Desulfovibrio sp.]|jgi:IS5 family transposase|nr:hypothetical protein [Desulfovibrio sp.]
MADTKFGVNVTSRLWKIAKDGRGLKFSKQENIAAATRRIHTMAGALLKDVVRKFPLEAFAARDKEIKLYDRVFSQKYDDKNKIYSLHEPDVFCICKGKERKKN